MVVLSVAVLFMEGTHVMSTKAAVAGVVKTIMGVIVFIV